MSRLYWDSIQVREKNGRPVAMRLPCDGERFSVDVLEETSEAGEWWDNDSNETNKDEADCFRVRRNDAWAIGEYEIYRIRKTGNWFLHRIWD